MLTDRGTENCRRVEQHDYELNPGAQSHQAHQDPGKVTANQWDLRAIP